MQGSRIDVSVERGGQVADTTAPHLQDVSPHAICRSLQTLWPLPASEFLAAFQYRGQTSPAALSAVGRAAEIRVYWDKGTLVFEFTVDGRLVLAQRSEADIEPDALHGMLFASLGPFMAQVRRALADCIPGESHDLDSIPLLGGWKAGHAFRNGETIFVLTLPRLLIRIDDQVKMQRFDAQKAPPFSLEQVLSLARNSALHEEGGLAVESITHSPDRTTYLTNIEQVLRDIGDHSSRKAVVTRLVTAHLRDEPDPVDLATSLAARFGQVYSYLYRWDAGDTWFGVSPEVLAQAHSGSLILKPLAGTRNLESPEHTEAAIRALLASPKEQREHQLVIDLLVRDLGPVCDPGSVNIELSGDVLNLGYAIHIKSRITAALARDRGIFDALAHIYPPATIWGVPRAWARRTIANCETFAREFFTGGLGYCQLGGDANFALVIRSACLRARQLRIYSGSGIVKGALPRSEWEETNVKMGPVRTLLDEKTVSKLRN